MADGTSNSGYTDIKWIATGATDDLNIDSDNDVSTAVAFPHKGKIVRVALVPTTAVSTSGVSTPVKVEIYKNSTTLVGTWTVGYTVSVSGAGVLPSVAYADCNVTLSGAVAVDNSIVYTASGSNGFNFEAGDIYHMKVVEAAAAGVVTAFFGYIRGPLVPGGTNVTSTGSIA